MVELEPGVRRVTFALPLGIDHVHCYLLRARDGSWTVVDTGLGLPDARERWKAILRGLDAPVRRIVVTHFHPDHVGAAADVRELANAPVHQGRLDYRQCVAAWGSERPSRLPSYLRTHGMPEDELETLGRESAALRQFVRFAPDPEPLEPGTSFDGWEVLHLPGHADGHLALLRHDVLIAGDALLDAISPNVGLYPDSRPDPLAAYLSSLARIAELAPRVAYAGHGKPIQDPALRAGELVEHHRQRLELTLGAVAGGPRTAYDASLVLFADPLPPALRRFAVAETRAHLEHLVGLRALRRLDEDERVLYEGR